MVRPRQALLFAVALVVVSALAWSVQQHQRQSFEAQAGAALPPGALLDTVEQAPPAVAPSPVAAAAVSDRPQIDPAWAQRTATAAGIPVVALTAYARATLLVPDGCRLGWTTLAGIGWVESHHGTIEDRLLAADGRSAPPIVGPALDGVGPVAAIAAPAGSHSWHGDDRWDHAVGPMQFISDTWQRWASDGDGDGLEDPHDVDDAAFAAARYLCASGADLATGEGWSRAIFSYNHAESYVNSVRAAASFYAARSR